MENLTQQLKALSSAEDFLQFFGVPFDQKVVNVSRLHILKRFFQYIRQQAALPADAAGDGLALFTAYRALLEQAYGDFVVSTPAREKVFKVFQDVDGQQHVSLDSVRAALPARALA
ncbi:MULTISPECIES: nitrogenase stabilizing/protective protein NifW [Cupriavidus]